MCFWDVFAPLSSFLNSRDSRTDVLMTLDSSRYDEAAEYHPTFEHRLAGPGNEAFQPSLRTN